MKLIERQRIDSKFRKKYDTPATPCDRLLACAKVSEETKVQLRATRRGLDPMDLAADIEARLARIFTLVERIEEDRQDEMDRAGKTHPQRKSLSTPPPKNPKPNQAPGVMNPSTTTHPLRCHLSLEQYDPPSSNSRP